MSSSRFPLDFHWISIVALIHWSDLHLHFESDAATCVQLPVCSYLWAATCVQLPVCSYLCAATYVQLICCHLNLKNIYVAYDVCQSFFLRLMITPVPIPS